MSGKIVLPPLARGEVKVAPTTARKRSVASGSSSFGSGKAVVGRAIPQHEEPGMSDKMMRTRQRLEENATLSDLRQKSRFAYLWRKYSYEISLSAEKRKLWVAFMVFVLLILFASLIIGFAITVDNAISGNNVNFSLRGETVWLSWKLLFDPSEHMSDDDDGNVISRSVGRMAAFIVTGLASELSGPPLSEHGWVRP